MQRSLFLAGCGAAAAGALALGAEAPAQPSARRIDVHHHVIPKPYLDAARPQMASGIDVDLEPVFNWTPRRAIEEMDRNGVATGIGSLSAPGVAFAGPNAKALARACNEAMAEIVRDHPGRFGHFAVLPLPDVAASLDELAYALDTLHADGVGLFTSYRDLWPGDVSFAPLWAELNRRKALVFIHPAAPACCMKLIPQVPFAITEFMFDVTRAITSLLFSGTFAASPDVRFIFTHAGATMPSIAVRIEQYAQRHPELREKVAPNGVLTELRRLYYDVANSTFPTSIAALRQLVPSSQLLFGSDYPYVPMPTTAASLPRLGLPSEVARAIDRGNAQRLLPRLA